MKTLTYKNTKISYYDIGKGNAVVLLHGFLENQTMWQDLVPELSEKYRVITLDLLGHGESGCLGYVHSMEENAEAVRSALREAPDVLVVGEVREHETMQLARILLPGRETSRHHQSRPRAFTPPGRGRPSLGRPWWRSLNIHVAGGTQAGTEASC